MSNPLGTVDFRPQATFWIAISALVLITPFALNNVIERRVGLGVASLAIVALLLANAWTVNRGDRRARLPLAALMGAMIVFLAVSISQQREIGVVWCFPAVLAIYCMLPERWAWTANALLLGTVLPIAWRVVDPGLMVRATVTLCAVSMFTAILVRVISVQHARLRQLTITDPLTGCRNRITLDPELATAIATARRDGTAVALLAIDIDHFKRINDELGHASGDHVLRTIGATLLSDLDGSQRVFRTGGEEFLLLAPGLDEHAAGAEAERLRVAIRESQPLPTRRTTASVGVAVLGADDDANSWLCRADDALYLAKGGGRDRCALAA